MVDNGHRAVDADGMSAEQASAAAAPADTQGILGGAPPAEAAPTREAQRISALDVYRGVALCGILLLNIVGFGMPGAVMDGPFAYGAETWLDRVVVVITELFVSDTMRASFSLLFGAGVILLTSRIEKKGASAADIHYRRNIWLIVFGLVHAYIMLWPGDILYRYGIASLFLYPFRNVRPWVLILLGVLCIAPMTTRDVFIYLGERATEIQVESIQQAVERGEVLSEDDQQVLDEWNESQNDGPTQEDYDEHISMMLDGYAGPFLDGLDRNLKIHSKELYKWNLWDALIFMFIGMGLFKMGVLSAEKSARFYITLMCIGYPAGLLTRWWLFTLWTSPDVLPSTSTIGWFFFEPARIALTLAHMSVIMLLCKANVLGWLKAMLAAAGRMALTNYVSHTVICGFIFLGFGLGWYGKLTRAELLLVVFAIWAVQLPLSVLWLRMFRFGPLEWLWRSLTYVKLQPMRR